MSSLVVKIASIHPLLALIAHLDFKLFQMDIKTAFSNDSVEEDIYRDQPIDCVSKGQKDKVCCLKKSIYGLKELFRSRYFRFHEYCFLDLNMISENHGVYAKKTIEGIVTSTRSVCINLISILFGQNKLDVFACLHSINFI